MKNPVSVKKNCLCTAYDTDTVAAVAGGLTGLYYGYTNIMQHCISSVNHMVRHLRFPESDGS